MEQWIEDALPLTVGIADPNEPFFTLSSDAPRWALAVSCPWTLRGAGFNYESEEIASEDFDSVVEQLRGRVLVRIDLAHDLVDPVFHFEGGIALAMHADTWLDPWVLQLPGAPVVLVGGGPSAEVR